MLSPKRPINLHMLDTICFQHRIDPVVLMCESFAAVTFFPRPLTPARIRWSVSRADDASRRNPGMLLPSSMSFLLSMRWSLCMDGRPCNVHLALGSRWSDNTEMCRLAGTKPIEPAPTDWNLDGAHELYTSTRSSETTIRLHGQSMFP